MFVKNKKPRQGITLSNALNICFPASIIREKTAKINSSECKEKFKNLVGQIFGKNFPYLMHHFFSL